MAEGEHAMSFYTGVGSRETPPGVQRQMMELADWLRLLGYTLRSGGAGGADTAFEMGAMGRAHIYLPWQGFNGRYHSRRNSPSAQAYSLAATIHPAWNKLGPGPRSLHARNCHQVLGDKLDSPSAFLVCWTPDACTSEATRSKNTGGTATAIVLAERNAIPVFNLRDAQATSALDSLLRRRIADQL